MVATLEEAATSGSASAAAVGRYGSEALSRGLSDGARKQLVWWLGGTAAWVYSMVVLGGVTRLTRSGLSMTEWKFTGMTIWAESALFVRDAKFISSP